MFSTLFRLKLMKKFGYIHYAFSHKMFHRPLANIALFIVEFCVISYGYVLLHNGLSPADVSISYSKSMYFTVISATTVGYGDHFPIHTITQWYVILLMIIYLPFRFFYTAGIIGFLFKNYKDLKSIGRWFPMLYDHIIVYCNAESIEKSNFLWLDRFVAEKKRSLKYGQKDILLVNNNQAANEKIISYFAEHLSQSKHIHLVNSNVNEEGFFDKIHMDTAERVYVLADESDANSDSAAFDIIYRMSTESTYTKGITVELVHDNNRERLRKLGADVILRPNRSMPEMLITCTIAPGSAQMIEEITSRGGDSIERFSIQCENFVWGDLLYQLSMHDIGTATAVIYDAEQGERVDPNPMGKENIKGAKAILVLINAMNTKSYETIQQSIDEILAKFVKCQ